MNRILLIIGLWGSMSLASAALYKWVDDNGRIEYSDKPPPKQSRQGFSQLNRQGITVKQKEGYLNAEQKLQREAEALQKRQEAERAEQERRRDRALIDTFSDPKEIDTIRDRNIERLGASIAANRVRLDVLVQHLETLRKRVDIMERKRRTVAEDILADVAETEREINKVEAGIRNQEAEILQVQERAETDKKRLMALKGLTTTTP